MHSVFGGRGEVVVFWFEEIIMLRSPHESKKARGGDGWVNQPLFLGDLSHNSSFIVFNGAIGIKSSI